MQLLEEEKVECRLFTNITNASEVTKLTKKKPENQEDHMNASFLSGKHILHPHQLKVAVHRVIHAHHNTKLITNSLSAEIVFVISGCGSTSQAFRRFAVNEQDQSVVVVLFGATAEKWEKVRELVQGTEVALEDIPAELEKGADMESLINVYGLTKNPIVKDNKNALLSAMITAIATQKI